MPVKYIALIVVPLSLFSGFIASYIFTEAAPSVDPSFALERSADVDRITALEREVLVLSNRLQEIQDEQLVAAVSNRVPIGGGGLPHEGTVEVFEGLLERLRKVEESLVAATDGSTIKPTASRSVQAEGGTITLTMDGVRSDLAEEELFAFQAQAIDPLASDQEKLEALRALRGNEDAYGDARNHDVVLSMIDLVATSEDASVRADVYRQLSGVTDPVLREPLLNSLAQDLNSRVREEAAETIGDFLPDPAVEAALRFTAQNDESAEVRKQARECLEGAGYWTH